MRRMTLIAAAVLVGLAALIALRPSLDEPLVAAGSLVSINPNPAAHDARTTGSRVRLIAPRRLTLAEHRQEACNTFLASGLELSDIEELMRSRFLSNMVDVVALCKFPSDEVSALLLNDLVPRIEEGDREAAELAYVLAGTQCDDSPKKIDQECADLADEEGATISSWRSCVSVGYASYRECTQDRLREYGADPDPIEKLYLSDTPKQMVDLLDQTKKGEADVEEALETLEEHAHDRMLVEATSQGKAGELANRLFGLSYRLGCEGDTELQARVDTLIIFWGTRYEMEHLAREEEDILFNDNYVARVR